jgi:hypothetical protein
MGRWHDGAWGVVLGRLLCRHRLAFHAAGGVMVATAYLLTMRNVIIAWVTILVSPYEFVFDAIEDELEKRSVDL